MFHKVLWATDGSAASDGALPFVKELMVGPETELVVFHSTQKLAGSRAAGQAVYVDEEEVTEKVGAQARELSDAGFDTELSTVDGSSYVGAAHDIAEAAERHRSDVIVVGTRGHTVLGGLLVGSVTQRLMHVAPCPVLVVPTAAGNGRPAEPVEAAAASG